MMTPYRKRQVDRLIADAIRAGLLVARGTRRVIVIAKGRETITIHDCGQLTIENGCILDIAPARKMLRLEP